MAALGTLLAGIGAAHVFSTTYLFSDPAIRTFCRTEKYALIAVPLLAVVVSVAALTIAPVGLAFLFVLFFVHYQTYHYGQQNLGVCSFSSIGTRRRGLSKFERTTIRLGVLCGVLGTYKILAPDFLLDRKIFPFNVALTEGPFEYAYWVGAALYAAIITAAAGHALLHLRANPRLATLYVCSVGFFLPMYLAENFLVAFLSFATAHGLQYLIFLAFHGAATRAVKPVAAGLSLFAFIVWLGTWIWTNIGHVVNKSSWTIGHYTNFWIGGEMNWRIAVGLIFGMTLAHFWFDQNLWKLRNPERRAWLLEKYPFLTNSPAAGQSLSVPAVEDEPLSIKDCKRRPAA